MQQTMPLVAIVTIKNTGRYVAIRKPLQNKKQNIFLQP